MITATMVYLLAGAGLGVGAVRAWQVFHWNINLQGFTNALVMLIGKGDWIRCVKLCAAAPSTLFVQMVKPAIIAGGKKDRSGLHRAAAMREAYREASAVVLARDRHGVWLSSLAGLFCLAAGAVGLGGGVMGVEAAGFLVLPGCAIAYYSFRFSRGIQRRCDAHFDQVVQAAIRAE